MSAQTPTPHPTPQPAPQAEDGGEYLTIGSLAKLCNVTVRTLRYYEEMDLIGPVKRSTGKYRLYNRHSLKRINAILALQGLNFSLEQILEVLGPYSVTRNYTKEEQIAQTRHSLGQQKAFIHEKIDELQLLNQDIEKRLQLLDDVCNPCVDATTGHQCCSESCSYIEIHH